MPQASDELREKMREYYGDAVDDAGPMRYLEQQGYTLQRDWSWLAPVRITNMAQISMQERDSIIFLIEEWDMDGVTLRPQLEG